MPIGQELLNVPMGEMIGAMAKSIAASQIELDRASIEVAEMMGGLKTVVDDQGNVRFDDSRVYFGHEYMTLVEAMLSQTGLDTPSANPAASGLVAGAKLIYKAYAGNVTDATEQATLSPTQVGGGSGGGVALTPASLAAYQAAANKISDRISVLESRLPTASSFDRPHILGRISDLKGFEADNKASVSSIFERQVRVPTRLSLLELGFAPTFYQFVDTIIEVKISITITQESTSEVTTQTNTNTNAVGIGFKFTPFGKGKASYSRSVQTAQVNATYGSKYSHTAEGSSLLRTKLTPLPPPAILEERIRAIMAGEQARRAAELALMTAAAATPPPPPPAS